MHVDHPAALTDLQHQGAGGHKRVRAGVNGLDRKSATCSSSYLAITDTCLSRVDLVGRLKDHAVAAQRHDATF